MQNILGTVAACASLLIIFVGFPQQIYRNHKNDKVDGLAPMLVYSAVITYTAWTFYAWSAHNIFLEISQTPGMILSLILLYQLLRKKKSTPAK
jgi:uncharacterized protein with PQ loop repeat